MGISNFKMCGLEEVIRNKMNIPKYQRSYAWGRDEYSDLWDDLDYLVTDGNEMHFYGQIVIHKNKEDDNKFFIIDGQQRITTSFFLIRAFLTGYNLLLSKFKDPNCKEAKKLARKITEIEQLIGYNSTENISDQDLNLIQNDIDNEYFIKLICNDPDALKEKYPSKSSKNLMKGALKFFDEKIKNLLKNENELENKLETLNKYFLCFTKQFKVMYLEDDNLNEAYTIFETLNDRGRDLASTDLLKNYVLANSANVENSYKKWNKIVTNLDSLDITKFIRHVWNSEHSFTREKTLYAEITSDLQRSGSKCDKLLDALNECSSFYHDLFDYMNPKEITDMSLLESLKALKTMKSVTWCPVLIAMYNKKEAVGTKKYQIADIARITKSIENLVFRNFLICSTNPNEYEIKFSELAKNITLSSIAVNDIESAIKSWIVSDDKFELDFKELSFSDTEADKEKIRYIFRKIHKFLDHSNEINQNNSEVHIEHIMPQDKTQWPQIPDDIHEKYLWKLGNLCLLSGILNVEISNKPFDFKKENAYSVSVIKPNDELLAFEEWTEESIKTRQIQLLNYVKQIWH